MRHYYVYYRVEGEAAEAEAAVRGAQARLACRTGVRGRLLRKRGEPAVWMEVYEEVDKGDAFEHALAQLVSEAELEVWLPAGESRHLECFED